MLDFTYYSPIKLYFGKGEELNAGKYVREYGGSRVLLHYGGGSVVRSGLLDLCAKSSKRRHCRVRAGRRAAQSARRTPAGKESPCAGKRGIDFIIALGGRQFHGLCLSSSPSAPALTATRGRS